MSESKSSSSGIGFCGALFIVFLTLKLCGVIDWSWWWIASPLWIPFAAAIVAFVVLASIYVVAKKLKK